LVAFGWLCLAAAGCQTIERPVSSTSVRSHGSKRTGSPWELGQLGLAKKSIVATTFRPAPPERPAAAAPRTMRAQSPDAFSGGWMTPSISGAGIPAPEWGSPGNADLQRGPMAASGGPLPAQPTTYQNYQGGPSAILTPSTQPADSGVGLGTGPILGPGESLEQPWTMAPTPSPTNPAFGVSPSTGYQANIRDVPLNVYIQEGQTGRFVFGGAVNTDLGVSGQVVLEERNFDIRKLPRRPSDLFNGAFRGNGENFRLELMPGNRVQRYSVNWTQPNLFGYTPFSLALGGFYFNRIYRDWDEQRLGARAMLGYEITSDLSLSTEIRGEDVKIYGPRVLGVPILDRALGSNDVYTGRVRLAHNTRDSQFLPTEGHLLEMIYDQVFGEFDYPRGQVNYSKYFLLKERPDRGGRHTLTSAWRLGFSGVDTPIFENFFAGGHTTMRGFSFRGASPVEGGVQVGGRFQFLGSLEYMFPLTADDMIRMVAFVDYGTIERNIEIKGDNFRVAPGLGLRIAVPALGPAPLAFDFAYPVAHADTDDRQLFSFSMGLTR
jgi:outer membrane protein insertion porin family